MGIFKRLAIAYVTIAVCNKLGNDLQYMLRELPRECKKIKIDAYKIAEACKIDTDRPPIGFHY